MQGDAEYWVVSALGGLVSWLAGWIEIETVQEAIITATVWALVGLVIKKADQWISNKWKQRNTKPK